MTDRQPTQEQLPEPLATRVDALCRLTGDILEQGSQPELPALGQLVLQRDQLLCELAAYPLDQLTEGQKAALAEKLSLCRSLDAQAEAHMRRFQDSLQDKLRNMKTGRAIHEKYRLTPDDGVFTESSGLET